MEGSAVEIDHISSDLVFSRVWVCSVRREMEDEVGQMQQTIEQMDRSCDSLYVPCDPDPAHSPVCRNLTRKQGYLYIRK